MQKSKGLGRGLGAILDLDTPSIPDSNKVSSGKAIEEVDITLIVPNPKQPRKIFDEEAINELADSIRSLGVIQPVTIKQSSANGFYTIISGERRWRAAQIVGLTTIPAYIRDVDDQTLHEMALVENIQRQDLNPIEVATGLQRLIDECNLTQDILASRVGKKRSTIANYMRLLKMPLEVQSALKSEYITMGHAKAIAGASEEMQVEILKRCIKRDMSVRQLEDLVKKLNEGAPTAIIDEEFPEEYSKLVEHLESFFTQNISIKRDKKGGGKIVINFENDKDVEQFLTKFESVK